MEAKYEFDLADKNQILGEGSFGQVHLFINKNDRQEYAGKHMKCEKPEDFAKLLKEKIFQHKLNLMPGVMPLADFFIWEDITKGK